MSGTQTVTLVVTPPDPEVVTVQREIVEVRLGPIAGPPGPPGDGGGGGTVDSVARAAITSHTGETTAAHGGIVASTDPRLSDARTPTAHTHPWSEVTDKPLFGSAATADVGDFATATQGSAADTAVQPGDLATVATTGAYDDLTGRPTLGTAAAQPSTAFATAAQGAKADSAVQPAALTSYTPTSRTLAGLDLSANRSAADLCAALGVRPGVIAPPLPCALSIMASRIGSNVSAVSGTVYWLPLELLAIPAKATHLWLSVATTGSGVARLGITSAVSAADDTPGPLVASTAAAAVDAASTGARGAALTAPVTLTAGVRYYLTAYISTAHISSVGVEGPLGLLASATGSAPVTPAATMAVGWRLTGQSGLVSNPTGLVPTNVMPLLHVSLEAP